MGISTCLSFHWTSPQIFTTSTGVITWQGFSADKFWRWPAELRVFNCRWPNLEMASQRINISNNVGLQTII